MTLKEIINSFQKNQLYYSNECINNYFHFKIYNQELPQIKYPFLAIPSDVWVYVEMGCNIVILKYENKKFFFAENEQLSEAYKLIEIIYKGCDTVLIQNNESVLNYTDNLKRFVLYEIKVIYKVFFKNIEKRTEFVLKLDFLSKISDARKELFERFCKNDDIFSQEEIIIYNGNMNRIDDYTKLLKDIQNFEICFYFEYKQKSPKKENAISYKSKYKRTSEIDSKFIYCPPTPTKSISTTPEKQQKYIFDYKSPKNRSKFSTFHSKSSSNSMTTTKTQLSSSQINTESTNSFHSNSPNKKEEKYIFDYKSPTTENQLFFDQKKSEINSQNAVQQPFEFPKNSIQQSFEFPKNSTQQSFESPKNSRQQSFESPKNRKDLNKKQQNDSNSDNNEYDNFYDDDFQINLSSDNKKQSKENETNQNLTKSKSKSIENLQIFEEEEEEIDFDNKSDNSLNEKNKNQSSESESNSVENNDTNNQVKINNSNEVENSEKSNDSNNSNDSASNEEDDSSNSHQIENDIYKFLEEED